MTTFSPTAFTLASVVELTLYPQLSYWFVEAVREMNIPFRVLMESCAVCDVAGGLLHSRPSLRN